MLSNSNRTKNKFTQLIGVTNGGVGDNWRRPESSLHEAATDRARARPNQPINRTKEMGENLPRKTMANRSKLQEPSPDSRWFYNQRKGGWENHKSQANRQGEEQ